jgi:hypothetical protein
VQYCTPVQRKLRFTMNQPEGAKDMLGHAVSEAGESPSLPAQALPTRLLEAGLKARLTRLAGGVDLLQLNQLLSDLLTKIMHTLRPIKPNIK